MTAPIISFLMFHPPSLMSLQPTFLLAFLDFASLTRGAWCLVPGAECRSGFSICSTMDTHLFRTRHQAPGTRHLWSGLANHNRSAKIEKCLNAQAQCQKGFVEL